jgi:drug/metabolite transporter (DMT)-like permease
VSVTVKENRIRALGLRLFSVTTFSAMGAAIKLTSESGIKLPEIMFWRQFLALPVVVLFIAAVPGFKSLRTNRMSIHARRTVLGLMAMTCTFGALVLLPLAEATTFSFTVPVFATILAAIFLHERVGVHRWAAVLLGFAGVLIVLQPGQVPIPLLGAAVGLAAAFMVGVTSLQIRELGRTEASTTTVFWFTILSVPALGLVLPFVMTPHDRYQWLLLASIGTLGGIGQMAMTASLRYAPVSVVVVVDYSALIWSTAFGWLIWAHLPATSTWLGAPLIIASGLYIVWREHRLLIARPQEIAG